MSIYTNNQIDSVNFNVKAFSLIVLLFAVFPYIGIGTFRFSSEVQPWTALLAWIGVFIFSLSGQIRLKRNHFVIIIFGIIFLLYIPFWKDINIQYYLRKSISVGLSASLFIFGQYLIPKTVMGVIKIATIIWFVFALLGFLYPEQYITIIKPFIPGAVGSFGERGVTSLSPEATDFGFTMVYFLVLLTLSSNVQKANNRQGAKSWVYWLIFINILLSGSGSGIIASLLFFIVLKITYDKKYHRNTLNFKNFTIFVTFMIATIFLIGLASYQSFGIRGINLIFVALSDPTALADTTLSYRIAHNLVGIFGFLDSNLLGFGAGSFVEKGVEIYDKYNIDQMVGVTGWYASNIPYTLKESPLAMIPMLIFEYGLFGLAFLSYFFLILLQSKVAGKIVITMMFLLTLGQSFPLAYPLLWLLLGLINNPNYQSNSHNRIK